jgi:hypothetical protein
MLKLKFNDYNICITSKIRLYILYVLVNEVEESKQSSSQFSDSSKKSSKYTEKELHKACNILLNNFDIFLHCPMTMKDKLQVPH